MYVELLLMFVALISNNQISRRFNLAAIGKRILAAKN